MRRVVIVGADGRLGKTLCDEWRGRHQIHAVGRGALNLSDADAVKSFCEGIEADWVFNCAGLTHVDACEERSEEAFAVNALAPGEIARTCGERGVGFVHFSTDYVFDGRSTTPYTEEDAALPLGVYGKSKLAGERTVLEANPSSFVFRISWVFGPGRPAFPDALIERARNSESVAAVADKWASPTSALDLAEWLQELPGQSPSSGGLFHACNAGECTWQEYGQFALDCAAAEGIPLRTRVVLPQRLEEIPAMTAPRPVYSAMNTAKLRWFFGVQPRSWKEALKEFLHRSLVR